MAEKSQAEIPRNLREQYLKGKVAFEKDNLDYAIQLLTQVLDQEPGFFECRQALRATQFKRSGVSVTSFFRKLIGTTNPNLVQARMLLRNDPAAALKSSEQVLNGNPNLLDAHRVLADAALALTLPRTAILSLEYVRKQAPGDRDSAIKLAQALAGIGEAARAEALMSEWLEQHPTDAEVAQVLKNISADRTVREGSYEALGDGQGSYRDILRDAKQAVSLEQEQRGHKLDEVGERLIAEQEERLLREPDNLRLVRSLAELLAQHKQFDRALACYRRILAAQGGDPSLEQAITDVQLRRFDQELGGLDPQSPEFAAQTARLRKEKTEFQLADCRRRLDRYPNDLELRFELGKLLFEAGSFAEAIPELQKAQNNPHQRIAAMYHLGRCFAARGMHDLAVRSFQNAIREKTLFDDEKKELIYALGCAFESMGRKDEAADQFKTIYEIDVEYQDVAARVDAYYAAKATG
ncbi:MAG: tetratricopeptide repeat protein [Limisphaerales bacterium]